MIAAPSCCLPACPLQLPACLPSPAACLPALSSCLPACPQAESAPNGISSICNLQSPSRQERCRRRYQQLHPPVNRLEAAAMEAAGRP